LPLRTDKVIESIQAKKPLVGIVGIVIGIGKVRHRSVSCTAWFQDPDHINQRRGLLTWKLYLITEYVEGQMLYDFLRNRNVSGEKRPIVAQQVAELLDKLGKHRII